MKNIHRDYINISLIFAFTVFLIVMYFIGYLIKFNNPSDKDLLSRKCFIFIEDYWALTHIMLFFIVTYIYPNRYIFIMLCGLLWEIIEYISGYIIKKLNYDKWWYGRAEDILYNAIGVILALLTKSILK